MRITLYQSMSKPVSVDTSWEELVAELQCLIEEERPVKTRLPKIAPHVIREGQTRSNDAVEVMTGVVLDLDNNPNVPALMNRIATMGIRAVVYGTPGDTPEFRKVRVWLDSPEHGPEKCREMRVRASQALGVQIDSSALDASRLFFAGRLPGTPPRLYQAFEGVTLSLDALPPLPPLQTPQPASRSVISSSPSVAKGFDHLPYALAGTLGPWWEHDGSKHSICGHVGGLLRKVGYTRQQCADVIRAWLPEGNEEVDVQNGVDWACRAWDKPAEEVTGTHALAEIIGEGAARLFENVAVQQRIGSFLRPDRQGGNGQGQIQGVASTGPNGGPSTGPIQVPYFSEVDLSVPPSPLQYVVPGLGLAPGKISVLQGFAGAAKTPIALMLALCVAAGIPFMGHSTVPSKVGYFDFEGGPLTIERAHRIRYGLGLRENPESFRLFDSDPLSESALDMLENMAERERFGMIVLDTYTSALPPEVMSFNDAGYRSLATRLGKLSSRLGTLILALVHENKSARGQDGLRGISGHGTLAGAVQAGLVALPSEDDPCLVELKCSRAPLKTFDTLEFRWEDVTCSGAPQGKALSAIVTRGKGKGKTVKEMDKHTAKANIVLGLLRGERATGATVDLGVVEARQAAGISGTEWPVVLDVLGRHGVELRRVGRKNVLAMARPMDQIRTAWGVSHQVAQTQAWQNAQAQPQAQNPAPNAPSTSQAPQAPNREGYSGVTKDDEED